MPKMMIAVLDTETTGTEDQDQVLEVAVVPVSPKDALTPGGSSNKALIWQRLIMPTVPVHVAARATHHITAHELLKYGFPGPEALLQLRDELDPEAQRVDEVVLCAHNAEFDLRLLRQTIEAHIAADITILPPRHICTWVCAKHLYPDSPGKSNQVLRYYLGLDTLYGDLTLPGTAPHRAAADAYVTSYLLRHMLTTHSAEELIRLTGTPVLQTLCTMPKHRGKTWEEVARVDRSYLTWMLSQGEERKDDSGNKVGFDPDTIYTLKFHLGLL